MRMSRGTRRSVAAQQQPQAKPSEFSHSLAARPMIVTHEEHRRLVVTG
jgi:hypothetical protein